MELSKQVCSLDLAKRLKELGVKQESLYYWIDNGIGDEVAWMLVNEKHAVDETEGISVEAFIESAKCSAFTCGELGEMLPITIVQNNVSYELRMKREWFNGKLNWFVQYKDGDSFIQQQADTEADARAKCLIYLLTEQLIRSV
jgi:hypothetical protein